MSPQQQSVATKKRQSDLWQIHGKFYDFESFVHEHPGGEDMIMLGIGRDCTELFESVHALSSKRPWELLKRYEIRVNKKIHDGQNASSSEDEEEPGTEGEFVPADALFTWSKKDGGNGFYETLKTRVREHVKQELKGNYKANLWLVVKLVMLFIMYMMCLYNALYNTHRSIYRYLLALAAGVIGEAFQFCIMHDGSHGALSKKSPQWNIYGLSVCNWFFWDKWLWMRHHVYAHHSYTGIYRRDPDLTNSKMFLRKHDDSSWKPTYKWQHLYVWLWLMIFPNQHWGQTFVYSSSVKKRKVFGVPLEDVKFKPRDVLRYNIYIFSFLFHFVLPIFAIGFGKMVMTNFFIWTAIGVSYFFVTVPNHDTEEVHKHMATPIKKKDGSTGYVIEKVDWGELQVRNSSNHHVNNTLLDRFVTEGWGGMNYQIEHHLFPSVSHVHYAGIAPIVQKTCKEFNIPYNAKKTWFHSMIGYYTLLKQMSKPPKRKAN